MKAKEVRKPTEQDTIAEIWQTLSAIDVNDKTKNVQGNTYLSWSWAWGIMKAYYPNFTHEVITWDGKPYLADEVGYMVGCRVTINGYTHTEYLMVTDSHNKAMKAQPYTITTQKGEKQVEACSTFEINTAIKRCMVKCFALFGLGHYIYADEDMPQVILNKADLIERAIEDVNRCQNYGELINVYNKYPQLAQDENFRTACSERKHDIQSEM